MKPVHKQTPEEFQRRMEEIHSPGHSTVRRMVYELQEALRNADNDAEDVAWQHVERARQIGAKLLRGA